MAFIKGYIYENESQAIIACEKCSVYYQIGKNSDDATKYWCDYQYDEKSFWYIIFDESLINVLGQPVIFEITDKPLH